MKLFATTAAFALLSTGLSLAAVDTQALVGDLQAQGYTRIEVKTGPAQVKIEAVRGTEKVETVYDTATGAVLKSETETVHPGDDIAAGVSYDSRSDDFLDDSRRRGSDDSDDSHDDSDGRSDDDRGDDSRGDDNGRDDNGGDRDDDRGDDHRGDGDRDDGRGDDDRGGED